MGKDLPRSETREVHTLSDHLVGGHHHQTIITDERGNHYTGIQINAEDSQRSASEKYNSSEQQNQYDDD